MNYLGKFLEKKLAELNISEREFALKCGTSHSYINQLIKGVNPRTQKPISPTLSSFEKISKGLGIPVDALQQIARGVSEETALSSESERRAKLLNDMEKKARKDGIPVGSKCDKLIPWETWNQIKEAHELFSCLGVDPSEYQDEEWTELLDDLKLVIKLHLAKRPKK